MKRYIKSAVILLAALSLAGCSKTDEFQYNPDSALQIESVSGISPFTMTTKAVITGDTLPGGEAAKGIGLFVTASDGGAYDGKTTGYSNMKYTYSSAKWSAASPIYLSNTTGKLYGYFPYSADATDLTAIPVASSLNGTDYLYATKQDVSFSNKSVNLQLNHALARLHLTIKKGDKYLSDCNLSKIVLQSKAIDANGTMDITTGAVTATKAADATGTFTLTGSDAVAAAGIEKDILLVPASTAEGKKDLTLTLTIDGIEAKVNFTGDNGLDLRQGIQNNVTLTIEDTGVKVTSVGVGVWGESGSQQVQVDGYTVTVKLDEEVVPNDLLTDIHIEGQAVIIKATSVQKRALSCNVGDLAQCQRDKDNGIYTFTINNIISNIEAVLSYSILTISVSSDSNGKAWIGDDESKTSGQFESGQQVVIHAAPNDNFRWFCWNDNNRETSRTITVGENDAEYSASFTSSDLIPGLFTVNFNGKQVFFSKGNLYLSNGQPHFYDKQYQYNSLSTGNSRTATAGDTEIDLFTWGYNPENSRDPIGRKYVEGHNKDGEILYKKDDWGSLIDKEIWRTLTSAEWIYLFNKDNTYGANNRSDKYKYGVTVCGKTDCVVLLPDDWQWGQNGVGDTWQKNKDNVIEYSEGTTITWSAMESAGAVCLPAAGQRGIANVDDVGDSGNYWSSTAYDSDHAYYVSFNSGGVSPGDNSARLYGYSVRLITECQ